MQLRLCSRIKTPTRSMWTFSGRYGAYRAVLLLPVLCAHVQAPELRSARSCGSPCPTSSMRCCVCIPSCTTFRHGIFGHPMPAHTSA